MMHNYSNTLASWYRITLTMYCYSCSVGTYITHQLEHANLWSQFPHKMMKFPQRKIPPLLGSSAVHSIAYLTSVYLQLDGLIELWLYVQLDIK